MDKTVSDLYQVLQNLLGLHRQLLDTVRLERVALVDADLPAIQKTTAAKQGLIEQIKALEVERLKQIGTLALSWKKPVKDLTLSNIIIIVQGSDQKMAEKLRSTLTALTVLIKHISDQNKENQGLVEHSLMHINEMKKNVITESVPNTDVYSQQGQRVAGSATSGARLISQEA